jgi:hypothetical protein
VALTTPAVDIVDVPVSDTDHTHNVVAYLNQAIRHTVGINSAEQIANYVDHGTDNTNGACISLSCGS